MYCKHCGNQMADIAVYCVKCGAPAGAGEGFCSYCGAPMAAGAQICTACGVPVKRTAKAGAKSRFTAGLLAILLGVFGVHNFYLGYTGRAVAQLLMTLLSCGILSVVSGIWSLVEGIMLLTGSTTVDGFGDVLAD